MWTSPAEETEQHWYEKRRRKKDFKVLNNELYKRMKG